MLSQGLPPRINPEEIGRKGCRDIQYPLKDGDRLIRMTCLRINFSQRNFSIWSLSCIVFYWVHLDRTLTILDC